MLGCLQGLTMIFLFVVLGASDELTRMRDGYDGLMEIGKAPIAGRSRTQVEGMCCLAVDGANTGMLFYDGLMGTLMVIFLPVERMVDLVPI